MRRMRCCVAAVIVLPILLGEVLVLSAQSLPEPRIIGGVFGGRRPPDQDNPDRSSHRATLDFDLAGGYDKTIGIDETTFIGSDAQQGGSIGAGSLTFQHRWGTSRNYLETTAHGNTRVASRGVDQQVAARSQIRGAASLGRRAGIAMAISGAYEPAYLFNAFGPLAASVADGVVPGAAVSEGFTEQRWLQKGVSGGLHRNWTTRQRTDVDYQASEREPLTGTGLFSQSQSAQLRHDWSYRERATLALRYRFDENRQTGGPELLLPLRFHHAGVGARFQRRLDRDRSFGVSFDAGATYLRPRGGGPGSTEEFIVPAASAGVHLRMSRNWMLSLDSTRNVTVLEGLDPHPFTTDAASLRTTGKLGRRTDLVVNAAYSHGRATMNDQGAFETAVGTVNLRHAIAVCCALTTTYMYYRHQLFDMTTVLAGFPSRQERNSVRVGLSFWVPLFGSFPAN
jgi:hypothetical protein